MKFSFFRRARKRDDKGGEEKKSKAETEDKSTTSQRLDASGKSNVDLKSSLGRGRNSDVVIPKVQQEIGKF